MNKFTSKEKIVAILICLMKRNAEEFPVCRWNDFIIRLINKTGVDPKEFTEKLCSFIP